MIQIRKFEELTCMALSGYTGRVPEMMKIPTAMATMTTARVRTPSCADLGRILSYFRSGA